MEKVNQGIKNLINVVRQYGYTDSSSYTIVKTFTPLFDIKEKAQFVPDPLPKQIGGCK